jgi:uncharacterized protein (TIGR00369 family)
MQSFAKAPNDLPPPDWFAGRSGLEAMQAMLAGVIPHPPMAGLLNYRLSEVSEGCVSFTGSAPETATNPMGAVHGGWYGAVLDSAMGCAVMTRVPRGFWYTTLEYKVNLTRALPLGLTVTCTATVRHAGRSTAVADAIMTGTDGRVYATGSTTCIILPVATPDNGA